MVKFVEKYVDVRAVGINYNLKEILDFKRKKMQYVTAKKANVRKNIVNVTLMASNVVKIATVKTVKIFDFIIYIIYFVNKNSPENSPNI